MTYKDAKQVIKDNRDILDTSLVGSKPAHMILGSIIAPDNSTSNFLNELYDRIKEEHISNEEILLEDNLIGIDNLRLFIVYKMRGEIIIMPIDSYLNSTLYKEGKFS
jgi:hypothetical protein